MDDGQKADYEAELLGVALTDVYSETVAANADLIETLETPAAADTEEEGSIQIVGIITEVTKTRTSPDVRWYPDAEMAHAWIEWQGERLRFVAFPKAYKKYSYLLKPNTLVHLKMNTGPKGAALEHGEILYD
jgi:hypothetical protein